MSDREVEWSVSLSGRLEAAWLGKVAQFGETHPVELSWRGENGQAGTAVTTFAELINPV